MKKRFLSVALAAAMVVSCVTTPVAKAEAQNVDLTNGLIGEYLFDGNWEDEVTDLVATPYSAWGDYWLESDAEHDADPNTHPGPLLYDDGTRGKVAELNGLWWNTGYIELDKSYASDLSNGFTVSMWAKANNSKTGQVNETNAWETTDSQSLFNFSTNNGQTPSTSFCSLDVSGYAWTNLGGIWLDRVDTAVALETDAWHQLTMVLDPETDTITTYMDGVVKGEAAATNSGTVTDMLADIQANVQSIRIGSNNTWWEIWDTRGYVDDVRMYNRALSAAEVAELATVEADSSVMPVQTIGAQTNDTDLGFVTTISKADFEAMDIKAMGVLVKNSANATEDEMTLANVGDAIKNIPTSYVTEINNLDNSKDDANTYAFRSIIKGVASEDKEYTAVPYITYMDGEEEVTVYGAAITRSIAGINA